MTMSDRHQKRRGQRLAAPKPATSAAASPLSAAKLAAREETDLPRFVNEQAAAEALSLSVKVLQNWRWLGKGPRFHKFGNRVRYSIADLIAYAESCAQDPKSDGDDTGD